jgi:uncharacterized caspase-like protein
MESGDFKLASRAFTQLGLAARQQRRPQAPFLMANTARAQLELGDGNDAFRSLQQALAWLLEDHRYYAFSQLGHRSAVILETAGFPEQAQQIRDLLASELAGKEKFTHQRSHSPQRLPEKCPYCGSTVQIGLTQLNEDGSALCSYCGSRINPD